MHDKNSTKDGGIKKSLERALLFYAKVKNVRYLFQTPPLHILPLSNISIS
jgi:hypothetical protein